MYFQMAEDEAQGIENDMPDLIQTDNAIVDELVSQERIDAENERHWEGREGNRTLGKGGKQTGNPKCRQMLMPKATAIGNQRTSSSRSRSRTQMPPARRTAQDVIQDRAFGEDYHRDPSPLAAPCATPLSPQEKNGLHQIIWLVSTTRCTAANAMDPFHLLAPTSFARIERAPQSGIASIAMAKGLPEISGREHKWQPHEVGDE